MDTSFDDALSIFSLKMLEKQILLFDLIEFVLLILDFDIPHDFIPLNKSIPLLTVLL